MKRNSAVVITIGSLLLVGCLLFPCWRWKPQEGEPALGAGNQSRSYWFGTEENYQQTSEDKPEIERSGWTFVNSPPTPTAEIDWTPSTLLALTILTLTAGTLGLCQVRQRDKEAGEVWKAKWQAEGDSRTTLLRASGEPTTMPQTLLRAADGSQASHSEQLLRATKRMGSVDE